MHLVQRNGMGLRGWRKPLGMACVVLPLLSIAGDGAASAMSQTRMHRAVYDFSLARQDVASDIVSLSGRMVVDWRGGPACGGYTMEQRIVTTMISETGQGISSDVRLSTWEAADAHEFHYERLEYANGAVSDQGGGVATRDPKTGIITVTEEGGEPKTLPANVLFPTAYNFALLDAAIAGKKTFTAALFDGTDLTASDVTAFVGAPSSKADIGKTKMGGSKVQALQGLTSWPVHLSYFDQNNPEGTPSFEMGFRLFPNGVSSDVVFHYDDIDMGGHLSEVEYFKPGAC